MKNITDLKTVRLSDDQNAVVILDQTRLPAEECYLELTSAEDIWDAIYKLKVRGAPAIGVAAAYGIYVCSRQIEAGSFDEFYTAFRRVKEYLAGSRPTAVNLVAALNRMEKVVLENASETVPALVELLHKESLAIREEDAAACRRIGEHCLSLLRPGMGILTHCNAGHLAVSEYGTALAPVYLGEERGYGFKVFADETRPLLQGARLTAYELNANKIGTSGVAILARHYGIPFYVLGPTSTIDMQCPDGKSIVIEERDPAEVTEMWYMHRMAPKDVKIFNPAFDVTPNELITAIITEKGIFNPANGGFES